MFHIGNKNPSPYFLNSSKLLSTKIISDLDIDISDSFSFDTYINKIIRKAYFRALLVLNNFHSFNPNIWAQAFKSYVRPCLEYSTVIWNPKNKGVIEKNSKIIY